MERKEEPDYQRRQTMTLQEAIEARHSVRAYKNEPLADDVVKALEEQIAVLNREGKLHMQLILNEPKAFQGTMLPNMVSSVMPTTILSWQERKPKILMNA